MEIPFGRQLAGNISMRIGGRRLNQAARRRTALPAPQEDAAQQ